MWTRGHEVYERSSQAVQYYYTLITLILSHCRQTGRPVQAHGQTSLTPNARYAQVLSLHKVTGLNSFPLCRGALRFLILDGGFGALVVVL